jgi:hypothetical protein
MLRKRETFNSIIYKLPLLLECVTYVLPLNSLIGHLAELRIFERVNGDASGPHARSHFHSARPRPSHASFII